PGFHINKAIMLAQPATTRLALEGMYRLLDLNNSIKPGIENVIKEVSGYTVDNLSVANLSRQFKDTKGLLFHDENDNLVPLSVAKEVVENWKSSQLYITKGLGHYRLIKSKEVIDKIVEWLTLQA
ncbi:MAG TPA: alpha/beta hydrolase, partial [Saprospiraceae bacterium]|nr:alpha/beta hydrolase [Saprospiraceae bacterium]